MKLNITGKGMDVSDYLRDTVTKKANKLGRYFKEDADVAVNLGIEKSRHKAEVTAMIDGTMLRCEEVSGDMYSSIDASIKKMERMIRRHRTKLERKLKEEAFSAELIYDEIASEVERELKVVKKKSFKVEPMSAMQAAAQMDMSGHSFFVFTNSDTGDINIVYVRHDGDVGLLVPEIE